MPKTDLSFEIKKHLAVLSTTNGYQKQANLISWNGKPECLDVRTWDFRNGNEPKPLKGVTLAIDEVKALQKVLARLPELTGQEE